MRKVNAELIWFDFSGRGHICVADTCIRWFWTVLGLVATLKLAEVISSFHEWAYAIARRPLSVCLSVCKLLHGRYFYHTHDSIATKLAHDGPEMGLLSGSDQGQGQRSRDTDASVMSRNVCYTVPSDVLSLHAFTLWSTVTLSFQYKCQAATCIVYIMEWATPSLTVWFLLLNRMRYLFALVETLQCNYVSCITLH